MNPFPTVRRSSTGGNKEKCIVMNCYEARMNFHPLGLVRNPYPTVHSPQSTVHSPQSTVHFYLQYTLWYCAWGNLQETQQSQHHISLPRDFEFAMVLQWWKPFRSLACSLTESRFLFHIQTGQGKLTSSSQRLYFGTKGKQNVYKPSRNLVSISSFSF